MNGNLRHRGRFAQTWIYFWKNVRMFVYQSDWKVLPIGALIAAVVTFVVGDGMFETQEGTEVGVFALVCVCVWNGFFNSIQAICRERDIVKREHRAGLHMSSYIVAEMLYQLLLCAAQTAVTLAICIVVGVKLPETGVVTPWGMLDTGITILLTTYAADTMALMVSCIVRTTTTAMTAMPFLLIFQLVFSGSMFSLHGPLKNIQYLTISHWGMNSLYAIGRYNDLPMVSLWNMLIKFEDLEVYGQRPINAFLRRIYDAGSQGDFLLWSGQHNQVAEYAGTAENVLFLWLMLVVLTLVFALLSIVSLQFIDRDKR